jgi:O-antigen/teichoic acid export membrane protein
VPNVASNSVWNGASFVAGAIILLVATPLYLRFLGQEQFGIFTLLLSITAPLGILNAGLAQATTKYVAEFARKEDQHSASRIIQTTLIFNLLFGCLGLALLWFFSDYAVHRLFAIPPALESDALWAFRLTGLHWLLVQVGATYQGALMGFQDFRALAIGQALQQFSTYGAGAILVLMVPRVPALVVLNIVSSSAFLAYWFWQIRRRVPVLRFFPVYDRASARLTFRYSGWQMLDSFTSVLANHMDRYLLGSFVGAAAVGLYGIAAGAQSRLVGLVWSILASLFPASSSLSSTPNQSERLILEYGWKILIVGGILYSTAIVFAADAVQLWLGPEVGGKVYPILRLLLVAAIIGLPSAVVYQYLLGNALTKWSTLSGQFSSLCTILVAWYLVPRYGLTGAAWGAMIGLATSRPLFHLWVISKRFAGLHRNWRCFLVFYGIIVSSALATTAGLASHSACKAMLGTESGLLVSSLITPLVIAIVCLGSEYFLIGNALQVQGLLELLRHGISLARGRTKGAACGK